jgi:lipid-A-disaccharide synthase
VPTVLLSCGEASGDLYGGALVEQLTALDPSVRALGFGGPRLQSAGATLVGDYRGLAVTGIVEVLRVLPRSLAMYRALLRTARAERPDVFVAIDFPDFNFRVASAMRRLAIPVVYYVAPQLWAWRSGRMRTLQRLADRILVIFPFEPEIYRAAGASATFVGHPLVDLVPVTAARAPFLAGLGLDPGRPTVALLPGSRPNELRGILPRLMAALPPLSAAVPGVQFVLARAPGLPDELVAPAASGTVPVRVVEGRTDDVLATADVAITASGTATVQAALHGCPMVIVYHVFPLSYAIGKRFVRVDTYGMVNLVAGERLAPELIQGDFTPDAVARATTELLRDAALRARTVAGLCEVRRRLGGGGASRRAADIVLEVARTAGALSA